jgi:hypothetical protein
MRTTTRDYHEETSSDGDETIMNEWMGWDHCTYKASAVIMSYHAITELFFVFHPVSQSVRAAVGPLCQPANPPDQPSHHPIRPTNQTKALYVT